MKGNQRLITSYYGLICHGGTLHGGRLTGHEFNSQKAWYTPPKTNISPPKFNIAPDKWWPEDYLPIRGAMLNFGEVTVSPEN